MVGKERFIDAAFRALDGGDLEGADQALVQASCIKPEYAIASYNMGVLRNRVVGAQAAVLCYTRALMVAPSYAAAASNLADALLATGQGARAEVVCLDVLRHVPTSGQVLLNLALVRTSLGRREEAEQDCRRALCAAPALASAWRAIALLIHERPSVADRCYQRAWVSGLRVPAVLVNRGEIAQREGRITNARAFYESALSCDPYNPDARANLAAASVDDGDFDSARKHASAVLSRHPEHPLARWIDTWIALAFRDFKHGYEAYDDPWHSTGSGSHQHMRSIPLWDGGAVNGAILIWCGQGLGDEVLYAGMIPDLLDFGVEVVLEADRRLVSIFQRSWPEVRVIARGREVPGDVVAQSSSVRLPMYFRRSLEEFPVRRSYLIPDSDRVEHYREAFNRQRGQSSVGFSWRSGNPRTGAQKSTRLSDWAALFDLPGFIFYSLQYDAGGEGHPSLQANPGPDVKDDIEGLAAQIAALDHVIGIAGVTSHLAGALGASGHVLLPPAPLWYWFAEGSDCPWYPSLTLVRRGVDETWGPTISRLVEEVRNHLSG
ncbi:MAG: hypothetical protein CMM47_06085 [Rhodospirillaceae bacterium]|nr:hypothetical protein [Rhodospirillaceae bacterium]